MTRKLKAFRPAVAFLVLTALFAALLFRIAYIENSRYATAGADETKKNITFGTTRGMIYDCHMNPLVNTKVKNIAVLIANQDTLERLHRVSDAFTDNVPSGKCLWLETDKEIEVSPLCTNIRLYTRYGDNDFLRHILGYTNAEGQGVAGLELSFDRLLTDAAGSVGIAYETDVYGTALAGEGLTVIDDNYHSASGIVTTIDTKIQQIAETALKHSSITQGAVVIMKAGSGEIAAMASVPVYDVDNLYASLNDNAAPFMNRALGCYPVGSVFKPFVAAAALLNTHNADVRYQCSGEETVGGVSFHCYNKNEHGEQGLSDALCHSCNCYFISMGQKVGAGALLDTCEQFGFHREIRLTDDILNPAGSLPEAVDVSPADLANLSFGQGSLTASPLQLAAAFNVFASDGIYYPPTLLKYLVDENQKQYAYYAPDPSYTVLYDGMTQIINAGLHQNMLTGTGVNGSSDTVSSAGKTATAQTGKYDENGNERLCTWFCGFFPYETPAYTVVVFNENGSTASLDCAPVFKEISENISSLQQTFHQYFDPQTD